MSRLFQYVGTIVAGIVVALALLIAVELFSAVVHPFPPGFQGTPDEMCRHVERYPQWVLAVVVPAWASVAFASAWLAGRLGNRATGLLIGSLLFAALVLNLSMLPYPLWFKIANLVAIPLAVWIADSVSRRRGSAALT